ncbi:MAG TPA: YdcF family protein [Acidimicrobiales bacterium]|jgi:vancomycin permeability regulator SanA|nr:YdcF family protein [Acidimicrobiales bacterium]
MVSTTPGRRRATGPENPDAPARRRPRPVRRGLRWLGRGLTALVVLAVGYVLVTAAQVWWTSRRNDTRPAQVILVMGAAQYNGRPSPELASRLGQALALWRAHRAPDIVVTGGKEPGDNYTEAEASAAWLEQRGVPASAIVAEVAGRDSWQSLSQAAGYLVPHNLTEVLLVSNPFHEERIVSMSDRLGLAPHPAPSRTSPIRGGQAWAYFGRETLAVAIGRVVGYGRLSNWMHGVGGSRALGAVGPWERMR